MSRRLTRHEMLEQDEFVTGVAATAGWIERHRRQLLIGVGVVAGVAVVAAAVSWNVGRRGQAAGRLLADAMSISETPIVAAGQQAPAGVSRTFPTAQARDEAVLASLDTLLASHKLSRAATVGAWMRGGVLLRLGRTAEARKAFEDFLRESPDSDLAPLARRALAAAASATGDHDGAIETLTTLAASPSRLVRPDLALADLARAQEAAGRTAEALATWRRLNTEHPQSLYASEAGEAIRRLEGRTEAASS